MNSRRTFLLGGLAFAGATALPFPVFAQSSLNGVKMANGMYKLVVDSIPAGASRDAALVGMRGALMRGGSSVAMAQALPVIAGVALAVAVGVGVYALVDPQGFARLVQAVTSGGIGNIFDIPLGKIATTQGGGSYTSYFRADDFPSWNGPGNPYPDTNLDGWGLIWNSGDYSHRAYARAHSQALSGSDVLPLARAGSTQSLQSLVGSGGPLSSDAAQKALVAESIYLAAMGVKAADPSLSDWVPVKPTLTQIDNLNQPIAPNVWPNAGQDPDAPPVVDPPSDPIGAFVPPTLAHPEPREWWDRWLVGLAPTKPIVPPHASSCPTLTIPWFDGANHTFNQHCQFFVQSQPLSRTVSTIGALIAAWRIVMEA